MHIYLLIKIKIHNTKNARHCDRRRAAFIYIAYRITPFTHRVQLNYRNMHMCDQKLHISNAFECASSGDIVDDTNKNDKNPNLCLDEMLALNAIKHDDFDVFDIRSL